MKKALLLMLLMVASFSLMAENATGKELTGNLVDKDGKEIKTDLSKKKYIIFYYTAAW